MLELAGATQPATIDGVAVPDAPGTSLTPTFAKDGSLQHEMLWWCHSGNQAIRMGEWKLSMRSGSK